MSQHLDEPVDPLLAGSIEEIRERLRGISADSGDDLHERVMQIALDGSRAEVVRAEAAQTLGRCSLPACRDRLQSLMSRDEPVLRQLAAIGLGDDQSEETIEWLIELLTDPLNKIRNAAERSLIRRMPQVTRVGVLALIELLLHPEPLTRAPAARLLGQTRDVRCLQPLLKNLESEDWLDRMWSAKGLGDLGDQAAVGPLVERLRTDEKNRVRAAVAEALVALRPPNTEELLKEVSQNDADEGVRKAAHEALLALGLEGGDGDFDPFAE